MSESKVTYDARPLQVGDIVEWDDGSHIRRDIVLDIIGIAVEVMHMHGRRRSTVNLPCLERVDPAIPFTDSVAALEECRAGRMAELTDDYAQLMCMGDLGGVELA